MKKYLLIVLSVISLAICYTYGMIISDFPGLKELIDKSDAIVILRIDDHIDIRKKPNLYTTHLCYIYQTLKGDIDKNISIPMKLLDTRTKFETPYSIDSTHLMFMTRFQTEDGSTEYYTIHIEGANIKLSPFGHEKLPKGKSIEEKIKNMIIESMEYFNMENKKENEFLNKIIV